MTDPGRKLKKVRLQLGFKYREVEEASEKIASQYGNREFVVGLSRLADIENKGTVPAIYRLYSLCTIYGLNLSAVLEWYGIQIGRMAGDAAGLHLAPTRVIDFEPLVATQLELPAEFENVDLRRTSYLSRELRRWGKVPAALLNSLDLRRQRYALIGIDDWSMYPILRPGSFVQIDEAKRRTSTEGWVHEYEKPIFFVEHRDGYRCGWCTERGGLLIVQSCPTSPVPPEVYNYPGEAEIVGQVVGVDMRLDQVRRRHKRS